LLFGRVASGILTQVGLKLKAYEDVICGKVELDPIQPESSNIYKALMCSIWIDSTIAAPLWLLLRWGSSWMVRLQFWLAHTCVR